MLATDEKMQKIEPGLNIFFFFFLPVIRGHKFQRQCVKVIDNMRLYLFINMWTFLTQCAKTFRLIQNKAKCPVGLCDMDKKKNYHYFVIFLFISILNHGFDTNRHALQL